jgi:hypothetical protein
MPRKVSLAHHMVWCPWASGGRASAISSRGDAGRLRSTWYRASRATRWTGLPEPPSPQDLAYGDSKRRTLRIIIWYIYCISIIYTIY